MKPFNPKHYSEFFLTMTKGLIDLGFVRFEENTERETLKGKLIGRPPNAIKIFHNSRVFGAERFVKLMANGFELVITLHGNRDSTGCQFRMLLDLDISGLNKVLNALLEPPRVKFHSCYGGCLRLIARKSGAVFVYPRIFPEDDQVDAAISLLGGLIEYGLPWAANGRSIIEAMDEICNCNKDKKLVIACLLHRGMFERAELLLEEFRLERNEYIRISIEPLAPMTAEEVEEHLVKGGFAVPKAYFVKAERVCQERALDSLFEPKA